MCNPDTGKVDPNSVGGSAAPAESGRSTDPKSQPIGNQRDSQNAPTTALDGQDSGVSSETGQPDATRLRLGVAAAVCIVVGVGLLVMSNRSEIAAAFLRVGIVGAAACLAFPTLSRIRWRPRNTLEQVAFSIAIVLMLARPRVFLPMGLLLGVILLFKIPGGGRSSDRPDRTDKKS